MENRGRVSDIEKEVKMRIRQIVGDYDFEPGDVSEIRRLFVKHAVRRGVIKEEDKASADDLQMIITEFVSNFIKHGPFSRIKGAGKFRISVSVTSAYLSMIGDTVLEELSWYYREMLRDMEPGEIISVDFRFPEPLTPGENHLGVGIIAAYCDIHGFKLKQGLGLRETGTPFVIETLKFPRIFTFSRTSSEVVSVEEEEELLLQV